MKHLRILLLLFLTALPAYSSEVIEVADNVEDVNYKVVKLLNQITNYEIEPVEKTGGFNYRYKSSLVTSSFRFNVYIGKLQKKSQDTLIRIEATKSGEAKMIRNFLQSELITDAGNETKKELQLAPKSHILNQAFNLVTPASSVIYSSYKSPMYGSGDTLIKASTYILIDVLILSIAALYINNTKVGNKSQTDDIYLKKGPDKGLFDSPHGGAVLAALALPRIYRAVEGFYDVQAHNRVTELSYTYRF